MSVKLDLKNKIINGSFEYWQRGFPFAAIANNAYHADRFHYAKAGAMVHTITRSTDVPSTSTSVYSLLATTTTIDAAIAATDFVCVLQHIEGNILRSFEGKKMVMTFWVKAFKTGTHCVSVRNGNATRSLVLEYKINASNTWEKKTVRFTHDTTGTWDYTTGIGLTAVFVIASGSTFNTTANTWQNGQFFATANQVNGVDSVSNTFQLADICMVEDNDGQTRVPEFMYAGRDYAEELQLCQRYYEKSHPLSISPGTATSSNLVVATFGDSAGNHFYGQMFKQTKRAIPIFVIYNPTGSVNAWGYLIGVTGTASNASTDYVADTTYVQIRGFSYNANQASRAVFHWTADAEL
jgi:hypothetical protein